MFVLPVQGRRIFAPDVRPNRVRDAAVVRDYLPSPAKKPRPELYPEERRPSKPFYKPEPKPAVIERKPVLNEGYKPTKDEWQALPQRELPQKRKPAHPKQEPKIPPINTAKPVVKPVQAKPVVKEAATVPPMVKKVTPAIKEVTQAVKKFTPAIKEVTQAVKKVTQPVKEVTQTVKKATQPVKEFTQAVKKVTQPVKEVTPIIKEMTPMVEKVTPAPKESTAAVKQATSAVEEAASDKDRKKASDTKKPTVSPNSDGLYELDAVTSSVLNDELQQIMIKVWQELPDSPPTDAEDLVANRFRNEAGDDLQNALGLSVTTRLLNVHNPLYVKLLFSGKPESGCLQSFIRKYNIAAFKRISDPRRDLFAAKFDDVADYDRLVAKTQLKCGSATVRITPCYKYLSCPPSVKTVYEYTDKAKEATYYSMPEKQSVASKTEKSAQSAVVTSKDTQVVEKKVNTETVKNENKKETNKSATVSNTETKATTANTEAKNTKVKETETEKPKPDKIETSKVPTGSEKATLKKLEVGMKNACDKSSKNSKQVFDDMMVVDEMGEEDDEEMTDQDILALMSGGIVLDECSGSDDEK